MTLEEALRLLMPTGKLGDEVHAVMLELQREGLVQIEEDGTLVLTECGKEEAHRLRKGIG